MLRRRGKSAKKTVRKWAEREQENLERAARRLAEYNRKRQRLAEAAAKRKAAEEAAAQKPDETEPEKPDK